MDTLVRCFFFQDIRDGFVRFYNNFMEVLLLKPLVPKSFFVSREGSDTWKKLEATISRTGK